MVGVAWGQVNESPAWQHLKELAGEKLPLFQNKNTRAGVAVVTNPNR
jgi:hypothetical protein